LGGAVLGFVLAVALLKLRLVDCEDWDLFAVVQGRSGVSKADAFRSKRAQGRAAASYRPAKRHAPRRKRKAQQRSARVTSIVDPSVRVLQTFRTHLEMGEVEAALAVYTKESRARPEWVLSQTDWRELTEALLEQGAWEDAVSVMRDYMARVPAPSPRIGLKLAQILLQKLARPLQALSVLEQIPRESLPETLKPMHRALTRQAESLRHDEDGPLEFQDELW
jgi:hypothetical protein